MLSQETVILLLTIGLLILQTYWAFTEPRPKKVWLTKDRVISYLLETIIVLLQIISSLYYPWPSTPFDSVIITIGVTMYIFGMGLAFWGRIVMKEVWGAPAEATFRRQKRLVIEGPFRFSRNPIYSGLLFVFFGYSIALRSWFIFLRLPLIFYFLKSAKQEEKNLEKHFGKQYQLYKQSVPRFLFI